jgi:hypothetical protein
MGRHIGKIDIDRVNRVKLLVYVLFRIAIVTAGIMAIHRANLALSLITLLLTFLPAVVRRELHIHYPGEFEIVILLFIYASIYLGEIRSFCYRFWWWDVMLLPGLILGQRHDVSGFWGTFHAIS